MHLRTPKIEVAVLQDSPISGTISSVLWCQFDGSFNIAARFGVPARDSPLRIPTSCEVRFRVGARRIGVGVLRIEADGLRRQFQHLIEILQRMVSTQRLDPKVQVKRPRIVSTACLNQGRQIVDELDAQTLYHRRGNIGLHLEDVLEVAIVGLRPELEPSHCTDQLRGDADLRALAPDAALEQGRYIQRVGNVGSGDGLALERE